MNLRNQREHIGNPLCLGKRPRESKQVYIPTTKLRLLLARYIKKGTKAISIYRSYSSYKRKLLSIHTKPNETDSFDTKYVSMRAQDAPLILLNPRVPIQRETSRSKVVEWISMTSAFFYLLLWGGSLCSFLFRRPSKPSRSEERII